MDPFIGEIRLFPFNFAPKEWADCDGRLLSIGQHDLLFSVIGHSYGSSGNQSFALPNLTGRAPLCAGTGPGLTPAQLGSTTGAAAVPLGKDQVPAHRHRVSTFNGSDKTRLTDVPTSNAFIGRFLVEGATSVVEGYVPGTDPTDTTLAISTVALTGGGAAHENRQPYLALRFCIALQGIYPMKD
ncbi:phage tail protein [Ancylobacter sp.]|uniref:phage tail protein n=1 Tax=Ancylobacter sp. TaxID=1872567 RepID=UPI003D139A45